MKSRLLYSTFCLVVPFGALAGEYTTATPTPICFGHVEACDEHAKILNMLSNEAVVVQATCEKKRWNSSRNAQNECSIDHAFGDHKYIVLRTKVYLKK